VDVFPNAVLLSGFKRELILMGTKGGETTLDLDHVSARLRSDPRIRRDLESILVKNLTDLVATFASGPDTLKSATQAAPPVTDDRPLMEYSVRTNYVDHHLPSSIFDASELERWCPDCYGPEGAADVVRDLPGLMEALQAYYATDLFLHHTNYGDTPTNPRDAVQLAERLRRDPCVLERIRANDYLGLIFKEPLAVLSKEGRPPPCRP
jgi:hypothetical protein